MSKSKSKMNFFLGCNALEKHPQICGLVLPADGGPLSNPKEDEQAASCLLILETWPWFGPRVTCTAWPIRGRDSLPGLHLRKPQRSLESQRARWAALLGLCTAAHYSSVPTRNLSAESSFDFSSATCRMVHRQLQTPKSEAPPTIFPNPTPGDRTGSLLGIPQGGGSSSHCPKPRSGLLLFKSRFLCKKKANTKTAYGSFLQTAPLWRE